MASGSALHTFVSALEKTTRSLPRAIERTNDAAGMHHLYLNRRAALEHQVAIDGSGTFFLSLFPCTGPTFRLRGGVGPHEYCHDRDYEPLDSITLPDDGLVFRNARGAEQRPIMLHASGQHSRLNRLQPLVDRVLKLLKPPAPLLEHPVLLVDPAWPHLHADGTCVLSTLAEVFAMTLKHQVEDFHDIEAARQSKVRTVMELCGRNGSAVNHTAEKVFDWIVGKNERRRQAGCALIGEPRYHVECCQECCGRCCVRAAERAAAGRLKTHT